MPKIDVSVGELFDKLSILEIKKAKGLDVDIELRGLSDAYQEYNSVISRYLYIHLKELNSSLWLIEDAKRKLEKEQNFHDDFIQYARLVYILNDQRARIKRDIDNVWNSEIKEKKSHDATKRNKDSQHLMGDILPNTKGAEIGVWTGSTSLQFLERGIESLQLIDPWSVEPYKQSDEYESYDDYLTKYSRILGISKRDEDFQQYYDAIYSEVRARVETDPRVTIHRMFSDEWFDQNLKK